MAPIISTSRGEYSSVDEYFRSLPCGYRFCPTDNELVEHYLMRKVLNQPLPLNRLHDVYIYDYHPKDLTAKYSLIRESDWFFFTATKRKYPRGGRPSRTAKGLGHWKATGKVDVIRDARGNEIGSKRTLEFLEGDKRKEATKTDWKMLEYKLKKDIAPPNQIGHGTNKLDNCVLVNIYQSSNAKEKDDDLESNQPVEHPPPPMPTLKRRRGVRTSTTSESAVINPSPFDQHSSQNGTFAYHPGQTNNLYNQNYPLYNMGMTSFASEYPLPDSIGMGTGLLSESVHQVPLVDSGSVQLPAHVREYENSSLEVGPGTTTTAKEGSDGDFMTLEELEYFYCDGLHPDQLKNKISS